MDNYTVLYTTTTDTNAIERIHNSVVNAINTNGGIISSVTDRGNKQMPYPTNGFFEGRMMAVEFEGGDVTAEKLSIALNTDDDVLDSMIARKC